MNKLLSMMVMSGVLAFSSATYSADFIRKNAHSPEAKADLKALSVALEKMRKMDCNDPRSWYFQGATHAVPNSFPTGNKLCPSYSGKPSELKWGWDTCPHDPTKEKHFLIWHRLYVAHFEQIVRELSGKADFALPYWDYTDKAYRTLPAPFIQKNNALYELGRATKLNSGRAIDKVLDTSLDVSNLMEIKNFFTFNQSIDNAPHGAMHVYVGGAFKEDPYAGKNIIYQKDNTTGLMASVPSAGFDPIFWLHHANIDYLWQKWEQSPNGQRPALNDLKPYSGQYHFIDAQGKQVSYTVDEAYNAAFNLNYRYDAFKEKTPSLASQAHKELTTAMSSDKATLWSANFGKVVDTKPVLFAIPTEHSKRHGELLGSASSERLYLHIQTAFTEEPEQLYNVYVVQADKPGQLAGVMSFFGAAHHAHHAHSDGHAHGITRDFTFDVTDELPNGESFEIVIEPVTKATDPVTITSASLSTR